MFIIYLFLKIFADVICTTWPDQANFLNATSPSNPLTGGRGPAGAPPGGGGGLQQGFLYNELGVARVKQRIADSG